MKSEEVRRPTNETIQDIRKLNAEYKLGQMLCKSRQSDSLLALIKRQVFIISLFSYLNFQTLFIRLFALLTFLVQLSSAEISTEAGLIIRSKVLIN